MPRCRHEFRKTWIFPARSRQRSTDSSPIDETKKSPGFGIWLSCPTSSQARVNTRSSSCRYISSLTKISRLICPVAKSTSPRRYPEIGAGAISVLLFNHNEAMRAPKFVIPAQAGIQGPTAPAVALGPRFRGGDGVIRDLTVSPPHCEILKEKGQIFAQQDILVEQDLAV